MECKLYAVLGIMQFEASGSLCSIHDSRDKAEVEIARLRSMNLYCDYEIEECELNAAGPPQVEVYRRGWVLSPCASQHDACA